MTKREHISYSELKDWVFCAFYHKLTRVDKIAGFKGNEWSHKKLKKKGYPLIKTVKARTRKSAIALAKNEEEEEEEYQEESLTNKECPMCAETVKAKAKICRYCKYEFE